MTTAPGLTISAVTILGQPAAATSTSAWHVKAARFVVCEWQIVTVC